MSTQHHIMIVIVLLFWYQMGLCKLPEDNLNMSWSIPFRYTADQIYDPQFIFINNSDIMLCYQDYSLSHNPGVCQLGNINTKSSNIQYLNRTMYSKTNATNVNIIHEFGVNNKNYLLSYMENNLGQIMETTISGNNISYSNPSYTYDSNALKDRSQLISISNTDFVICYDNNETKIFCRYGILQNNNIIFGAESQVFSSRTNQNNPRRFGGSSSNNQILKLSNTQFLICYVEIVTANEYGYCAIGNIDKSNINHNKTTIYYNAHEFAFNTKYSGTNNINLMNYDPSFSVILCFSMSYGGTCVIGLLHKQSGPYYPDVAFDGELYSFYTSKTTQSINGVTAWLLYQKMTETYGLEGEVLVCFSNNDTNNGYCVFGHIWIDGDGAWLISWHSTQQFINTITSGQQLSLFPNDNMNNNVFRNYFVLLCYYNHIGNGKCYGECRIGTVNGSVIRP